MRWAIAATANTITWLHIDSDGLGTIIMVINGMKVWIVLRALPNWSFADINFFLRREFQLDRALNGDYFGLEAIVLTPGTRL